MPDLDRRQVLLCAVLAVLVVGLGLRVVQGRGGSEPAAPPPAAPRVALERATERLTVHVAGAVRRPGVYRMRPGARVDDAVRRAGGPTRRAELSAVNLAAEVEDGRQVLVPERAASGAGVAAAPAAGGGAGGAGPEVPIDLNTATLEQLDTLDGIGPGLAQRILDFREEHGGFGSVAELADVPGIGPARMAALEGRVRV